MADHSDLDFQEHDDLGFVEEKPLTQKITSGLAKKAEALAPSEETISDIQDLGETGLDFAHGVGSGATFGTLDEIAGALSALGEKAGIIPQPEEPAILKQMGITDVTPKKDLLDLYRENQQRAQSYLKESQERSPIANIAGEIAGGVTTAPAIGAATSMGAKALGLGGTAVKAAPSLAEIARNQGKLAALGQLGIRTIKNVAMAAPAAAVIGATTSEKGGLLTPEERSRLGEDVAGSLLFATPLTAGMTVASEVGAPLLKAGKEKVRGYLQEKVKESPLLSQMQISHAYGTEGINPRSPNAQIRTSEFVGPGDVPLAQKDTQRSRILLDEMQRADQQIATEVGESLVNATNAGLTVDLSSDAQQAFQQIQSIAQKYPELADNTRVNQIFSKIAQNAGQVTPTEAKELIDFTDAYINRFKLATNKTPLDESVLSNLINARKQFSSTLKNAVPDYAKAAERLQQFRTLVPETLMSGKTPADITREYSGSVSQNREDLMNKLQQLIQGTMKSGTGEQKTVFTNLMSGMKQFEGQEAQRLASGQIKQSAYNRPVSSIEQHIIDYSNDAIARGSMDALQPHTGAKGIAGQAMFGHGAETGRSFLLGTANKAGMLQNAANSGKNPVAKMSRAIYNAPTEAMQSLSEQLKSKPGLEKYGKELEEALNSTNEARKNRILFTIMQNPSARAVVGDTPQDEE